MIIDMMDVSRRLKDAKNNCVMFIKDREVEVYTNYEY